MIKKIVLPLVVLFVLSSGAFAKMADFTWDVPTTRIDGSTLLVSEIAVYVLNVVCTGNEVTDNEYRVTINEYARDIPLGTVCTASVAVEDTDGNLSDYSGTLEVTIKDRPSAPTNLRLK